jgi:hypothetical protein
LLSHCIYTSFVAAVYVEAAGFSRRGVEGIFVVVGGVVVAVICAPQRHQVNVDVVSCGGAVQVPFDRPVRCGGGL